MQCSSYCLVIVLIERDGYLHNPDGIDITALWEYEKSNGTIMGFPGATTVNGNQEEVPPIVDVGELRG